VHASLPALPAFPDLAKWVQRATDLERLYNVGIALSAERDTLRLLDVILSEARGLCLADGGTVYICNDDDTELEFAIIKNESLQIARGGRGEAPSTAKALQLVLQDGSPNRKNVAACAFHDKKSFNIDDAYAAPGFDFSGTRRFDEKNGYRSQSFLTVPMQNNEGRVIGVLQLINARDGKGNVVPSSGSTSSRR
jgi:GAF domain-containing protein